MIVAARVRPAVAVAVAVSTAQLAVKLAAAGRVLTPYLEQTLNDALAEGAAVQSGFDAVQSPSAASDRLRSRLDGELSAAVNGLTDLLSAVRRGQFGRLAGMARPLDEVSTELDSLEQVA